MHDDDPSYLVNEPVKQLSTASEMDDVSFAFFGNVATAMLLSQARTSGTISSCIVSLRETLLPRRPQPGMMRIVGLFCVCN